MYKTVLAVACFCMCLQISSSYAERLDTCDTWIGYPIFEEKSEPHKSIKDNCDTESFVVLNYQYAKDKNYVYFKPSPNRDNVVWIVKDAYAKSFELVDKCNLQIPVDKYRIYKSNNPVIEIQDSDRYGFNAKSVLQALDHCPW